MKNSWKLFIPIYGFFYGILSNTNENPLSLKNYNGVVFFVFFGSAFVQAISIVVVFWLIFVKLFC